MPSCCACISCKTSHRLTYALIALIVTMSVVAIVGVDILLLHNMETTLALSLLTNIVTLWAQSPAQPLIDGKNANKSTTVHHHHSIEPRL